MNENLNIDYILKKSFVGPRYNISVLGESLTFSYLALTLYLRHHQIHHRNQAIILPIGDIKLEPTLLQGWENPELASLHQDIMAYEKAKKDRAIREEAAEESLTLIFFMLLTQLMGLGPVWVLIFGIALMKSLCTLLFPILHQESPLKPAAFWSQCDSLPMMSYIANPRIKKNFNKFMLYHKISYDFNLFYTYRKQSKLQQYAQWLGFSALNPQTAPTAAFHSAQVPTVAQRPPQNSTQSPMHAPSPESGQAYPHTNNNPHRT